MPLEIIVFIKQVPDTAHITAEAMQADGTVNRTALPTIINPSDLNALESALQLKDIHGGKITVLTMGPPSAKSALKECFYRGADEVVLISDKAFAGSDTLATSYILKTAVEKIGKYDLIVCGKQAIDGDTAQVGPQIAEKLHINQITFVAEMMEFEVGQRRLKVRRATENGFEILRSPLPMLMTVDDNANEPRPPNIKRIMAYKKAEFGEVEAQFKLWGQASLELPDERCGFSGSPTKVKKVEKVVLTAKDVKQIPNSDDGIRSLIHELCEEHIIG